VFELGLLLACLAIGAALAHSPIIDLVLLAIGAAATGLLLRALGSRST